MKASNTVAAIFFLSITNSVFGSSTGATSTKAHEIPNSGHTFPVHIGAEGHIVQGRISADALPGTMIPSNVIVEGDNDADVRIHLRVEVRDSIYKRPHVYHPDIKINTSDPGNPQFEHPVIEFTNGTLPYGMEFVVIHTNAFYVNEDRYICVNDFSNLEGESRIHFDVILKDKLSETHYVSNQLPFVVEIEYPVREAHPNAALFAGVLVLIILAVSLLIPFVVRAKRRSKAGKPICGCGPAEESCDAESSDQSKKVSPVVVVSEPPLPEKEPRRCHHSRKDDFEILRHYLNHRSSVSLPVDTPMRGIIPGHEKQRVMSIGGKENLAMILDNGRLMHARPSVDQSTTIQNRMLRSTSSMVFQPHWMDPHYQDVYERPDYHRMFYQGPGSQPDESPSSANSCYLYPPNFNLPVPARPAHGDMMSVHAAAVAKVASAANGGHRAANGDLSAGRTGGAKGADAPGAAQGSDSNDNLRDEKF